MLSRFSRKVPSTSFVQRATFATGQKQLLDVTPATLRASGGAMLDYYTAKQLPNGKIEGLEDSAHYCKLPNGLVCGGRIAEADRMLDHCVKTFMQPNGDFMNRPSKEVADCVAKTLHWEFADFYPYLNQWWITCGVRLNRFDFVHQSMGYVDKYWYNPKSKCGLVQRPIDENYENCIFNSSHLGLSYLYMGNLERAKDIGDTIHKMIFKQPCMDETGEKMRFYQRFDDNFDLLTSFAADDKGVKLAAIVNANEPLQCWWSLGYPAAFSAYLYQATGEKRYLESAERMLEFAARCNGNIRENIVSHKVMWAASIVGTMTGKKIYWDLCRDIASHIINVGQVDDGRVLNWEWEKKNGVGTEYGNAQVIDQTGEIAYWFFVVARQMEKAEIAGTLK